jgi:CPA1 family monovalent cation:H+ antiporter
MAPTLEILVVLLVVIAAVAVVAVRLKIPPAILLVAVGVVLAAIPGLPSVDLAPEIVLLVVLPPVIYSAAVAMSWREFHFSLRPIAFLAVGCVLFTTTVVAAAAHYLLNFPWAVGFVLGAIVSPPDSVAPLSIIRRMQLPHRIVVILEGEGLGNDATALILYKFAVAAVSTGVFSLSDAVGSFAVIVAGEIVWGIGVGWAMLRLRRWVRDPKIEILLSILTPYLAYWPPEQLGGSGVLATVTVGLYISWNGSRLISAATRLQGVFFWDFLIYLIEGMVFLITGLQAHAVISDFTNHPLRKLAVSAVVVSVVVIVSRFVWVYPATYIPRVLFSGIRRKDPTPTWQTPFALAFTGVRGIVSLAAALALPMTIASGELFPHRDLILFLAFTVVLVTLVGQGLTLPMVIRWLGLAHAGRREHRADRVEEFGARQQAIRAALRLLDTLPEPDFPAAIVKPQREHHRDRLRHLRDRDNDHRRLVEIDDGIETLMISAEREAVNDLYRAGKLKDEARRRIERELDLRAAHIANRRAE